MMGGLLHLVQQGEDWAGPQPAQLPARCTRCNRPPTSTASVPINILLLYNGPLLCGFNVPVKGLMIRERYFAWYSIERRWCDMSGFLVSNSTFKCLVMRYSDQRGQVFFDDFILCAVRLKTMFGLSSLKSTALHHQLTTIVTMIL